MEDHVIVPSGIRHGDDVGLAAVIPNRDVRDESCVENLLEYLEIRDCLVREAANPGPVGGPGLHALALGQRMLQASVRTLRRMPSISSNSFWPHVSAGASWTTGSPRSSARQ